MWKNNRKGRQETSRDGVGGSSQSVLEYKFGVMMRIQGIWFILAAFPSFILTFSQGSCVSFQGVAPWADFVGVQVLFVASSLALMSPRLVKRLWFLRYHRVVTIVNLIIQIGAMLVHARGIAFDGKGLQTNCFHVDFGGVWYTLVANAGGALLYFNQTLNVSALIRRRLSSGRAST